MLRRIGPVAVAVVLSAATNAGAAVIIQDNSSFVQPPENVLLVDSAPALTASGLTNNTATPVLLSQPVTAENIQTHGGGQARVDAADDLFTSLRIQLGGGLVFTELEANANIAGRLLNWTVTAYDLLGNVLATGNFISANGQNFFGMQADGGSLIGYVDIVTPTNTLEDVRQIRVGGVQPPDQGPIPAPEPGTLALMAVGALGLIARRRQNK